MEDKLQKIREEFGALVKRRREIQGLTIEELSDRAGIPEHYLEVLEQGKREPSLSTICAIAEGFGVSLGALFSEEHDGLSESTLALAKLYAESPEAVRQALPHFLNACIAARQAKARRKVPKHRPTR